MTKSRNPWLLRCAVVGLALVVGLIAWVRTGDNEEPTSAPTTQAAPADRLVSPAELRSAAAASGQDVYWVGPMAGKELELVELEEEGGFQVRYLPAGTDVEGASSAALTIGSYPLDDARAALENVAARPGATVHRSRDGGKVVVSDSSPTSAYSANPDNSVQIEVYDPSARRALAIALSGRVRPVD